MGEGAFKQTFLATQADGKTYALKIVRASADPARIEREVAAMLRCQHPNISVLHAAGLEQIDGQTYCWLLEEHLAGGSLDDKLATGKRLSADDVRSVGAVMISAIDHLRSHGLVHRDLKPANIMYRADGTTPVLVDFGLVRDLNEESLTQTWAIQGPGTPFFAAPEQLQNRKELIDWRTDQFSLGVVLAFCAFGRHPFAEAGEPRGRTVQKVVERTKPTEEFVAWSKMNRLAPLIRMVSAWPVQRYRTPDVLLSSWIRGG